MRGGWRLGGLVALVLGGCGSSTANDPPMPVDDDGGGAAPCAIFEREEDGGCRGPGVAPDGCAEGFAHDGVDGCAPVLPADPCPFGTMAVPGDESCRPVMDCGEGTWGDIPLDGEVVYVDQQAAAGGDGTVGAPFDDYFDAVQAAPPGATVAIAAGLYLGSPLVDKPLTIWGRCPGMVELRNGVGQDWAIAFLPGSDGSELHGVAVKASGQFAVIVDGATDVWLDRLWVHDVPGGYGVHLEGRNFPNLTSDARLDDSLIEIVYGAGIWAYGSTLAVSRTEIRDVAYFPNAGFGAGVVAVVDAVGGDFSDVSVVGSRVSRTDGVAMIAGDASLAVERTVVEDHAAVEAPFATTMEVATTTGATARSALTLRDSVLRNNQGAGVNVAASDALIERLTVRATSPQPDGRQGRGINLQAFSGSQTITTLLDSAVSGSHDVGVYVAGSTLVAEGLSVTDTLARPSDLTGGRGVSAQADGALPGNVELRWSALLRNHDQGLAAIGTQAILEGLLIADTAARPSDGAFGDGCTIAFEGGVEAAIALRGAEIVGSARAGVALFGARGDVGDTTFECNVFHLDGEVFDGMDFELTDAGGNRCGCDGVDETCKVLTSQLAAPSPLE